MTAERMEVSRTVAADAATIFDVVRSPTGHVAIDAPGMLQDSTGEEAGTTRVSSDDWSTIAPEWKEANIFPIIPESALQATCGILARTVEPKRAAR
jgi:hypothetical protein